MATHRPFRPLPLLGNPHVQTVLGNLLSWTGNRHAATVRTVPLPDGDALAIHDSCPPVWQRGGPIAALVHGLAGCHRSGYMRRIDNRLTAAGVRVVRIDLRGAGAGMKLARRFYNAACSPDVRAVIEALHRDSPASRIALLGFSLGGNVVLRLAAEAGVDPVGGLAAVVALAPPIDLVRCSELISRQPFYDRFYVRQLIAQVAEHGRHFPDLPSVEFPARATLRDFDEVYTAPRWGFANALAYYEHASATSLIPTIRVPCLILTARDDPFVAVTSFLEATPGPGVTIDITLHGGHLGFLGGDGAGGIRWAESRVISWARSQLGDCQGGVRSS
ncbi:MAG: alpha/beta fold hydrolase [Gemmataceae bacterium]|nr:alpha/beta fold hydrolase [Gemmataceae bacterium]